MSSLLNITTSSELLVQIINLGIQAGWLLLMYEILNINIHDDNVLQILCCNFRSLGDYIGLIRSEIKRFLIRRQNNSNGQIINIPLINDEEDNNTMMHTL